MNIEKRYISNCGNFVFEKDQLKIGGVLTPFHTQKDIISLRDFLNEYLDSKKEDEQASVQYDFNDPKELRFLELIKGLVEKEVGYWENEKGEYMIDNRTIENSHVWVSYYRIWSFFENEFGMNYDEIQSFMNNMLLKHFKIEGKTPENNQAI